MQQQKEFIIHPNKIFENKLYELFQKCKKLGNEFDHCQFKIEGQELIKNFNINVKEENVHLWMKHCYDCFEQLCHPEQRNDHFLPPAQKFIQKLTHRLNKMNVKKDNIYIMFKTKFTWDGLFTKNLKKKKIDIQVLKGHLSTIFCTNITGCHKLQPFYFYECRTQNILKHLKSMPILSTSDDEMQKILTNWYNNYFVKKCQQKMNVKDNMLLIVKNCDMFIDVHQKNITQNDTLELLLFPQKKIKKLESLAVMMKRKCQEAFENFCTSYNMDIYITEIGKKWDKIQPSYIKCIWTQILSMFNTKEIIITQTSSVKLISKFIKNVIEEDTKEISADIDEQQKKSGTNEEYEEKDIFPLGKIEYHKSYEGDEKKAHQELQENERKNKQIKDKRTEYYNSSQKIDEKECQLESTEFVNNDKNVKENLISNILNLNNEQKISEIIKKYEKRDPFLYSTIKYHNSHEEHKRKIQREQDNIGKNKKLKHEHTEYYTSSQNIDEKECQLIRTSGSVNNDKNVEGNLISDILHSNDKNFNNIMQLCLDETDLDEASLFSFALRMKPFFE